DSLVGKRTNLEINKMNLLSKVLYKIGLIDPFEIDVQAVWDALNDSDRMDCFGLGVANRIKDSHASCTRKSLGIPEVAKDKLTSEQLQEWDDAKREVAEAKYEQLLNGILQSPRATDEVSVECNRLARVFTSTMWKDQEVKDMVRENFPNMEDKDRLK